ncbi:hypothetical protein Aph02nite_23580 [Actinoplanes philippinensis]|nr:hypothetical protein Aph02nite_23580 [Actinoplanes philippinensis]
MPQTQDVTAGERVGEGAALDNGGGVGPIDAPDQRLELIEHRTGLRQQRRGILGRRLAFLIARTTGNPGTKLFRTPRRRCPQRKSLGKFHGRQYGRSRSKLGADVRLVILADRP